MKRVYIATVATALFLLVAFGFLFSPKSPMNSGILRVGFIYENDESTPYTYNFTLAEKALEDDYKNRVEVFAFRNVLDSETGEPLQELIDKGCGIIFTNGFSEQFREIALSNPDVQFCQVSYFDTSSTELPANYHTFNGETYQYQYVNGLAAGIKLRDMIDNGVIKPEQAVIGFVGNFPNPDVISSFTAFLLGVRSVAPEAVMRVNYTYAWSSYTREKDSANTLIDEGCVVIAQQSHTLGPAVACEEAAKDHTVFHVGNHQNMLDVAPTTSLISGRVNWTPYIIGAVDAILKGRSIERSVKGTQHGRDMSAGFAENWVEMLELNNHIAVPGTQKQLNQAVEMFKRGKLSVFKGNYTGVDPDNPDDTIDLSKGYTENAKSSFPSFHYILQDCITVEN